MAADQERADRIRQVKQENPQLKWKHIADHVGVELRSAQMWQETGAITYENAKKLAELVGDPARDVDWIMRGPRERAPSPFAGQDAIADRLDAIEQALADARAEREQHAEHLESLLRRQDGILQRIEDAIAREEEAARRDVESARLLDEAVQRARQALLDGSQRTAEEPAQQAK